MVSNKSMVTNALLSSFRGFLNRSGKNMIKVSCVLMFISYSSQATNEHSPQIQAVISMIESVNERDEDKYVQQFADDVKVLVENELKVDGKEALRLNRRNHFKQHPNVRSKIQHLVEIDNKVIMHDKVWLNINNNIERDIVEIFTFTDGEISRVDVIQPKALFE